ncbi:MAG: DUF89 family protein [Deltaproteobacteria bacterium]|nr:DUF89 family protein [Deltaproteobacteria bacterium]
MRTFHECLPCFVRQTMEALRMVTDDEALHEQVLRQVLGELAVMDLDRSPPEMAQGIHRLIRKVSGNADPYLAVKRRFNSLVDGMLPALRERIGEAKDPFRMVLRLALAGNIIDFGIHADLDEAKVFATVEQSLEEPIAGMELEASRRTLAQAKKIVYVADNAGELGFDKLFIEHLDPKRITLVVRGAPTLNDVTREDAVFYGLDAMLPILDTGSDAPGMILEQVGPELQKALDEADLVVCKGQGNYETLSGLKRPVMFLLRAKCPVIAKHIGVPVGRLVVEGRNL